MTCGGLIDGAMRPLVTYGTVVQYAWLTDFTLALGTTEDSAVMNLRNVVSNFEGKPCRQFAKVHADNPEDPEVWNDGTYTNTQGNTQFQDTLSVTTMLLVRRGIAFKNSTGTGLGSANAGCRFGFARCGQTFGQAALSLSSNMLTSDTGQQLVIEIGGWQRAAGLDKIMAALMIGDNTSTYLETQLVMRSAIDHRAPNAWVDCEGGTWNNPAAGYSERNTSALSIPAGVDLANNFLVQPAAFSGR